MELLSIDSPYYVCAVVTVLGQVYNQSDRRSAPPDHPYVIQEERLPPGVLTTVHGSRLRPVGEDEVLTDSDPRWNEVA